MPQANKQGRQIQSWAAWAEAESALQVSKRRRHAKLLTELRSVEATRNICSTKEVPVHCDATSPSLFAGKSHQRPCPMLCVARKRTRLRKMVFRTCNGFGLSHVQRIGRAAKNSLLLQQFPLWKTNASIIKIKSHSLALFDGAAKWEDSFGRTQDTWRHHTNV